MNPAPSWVAAVASDLKLIIYTFKVQVDFEICEQGSSTFHSQNFICMLNRIFMVSLHTICTVWGTLFWGDLSMMSNIDLWRTDRLQSGTDRTHIVHVFYSRFSIASEDPYSNVFIGNIIVWHILPIVFNLTMSKTHAFSLLTSSHSPGISEYHHNS